MKNGSLSFVFGKLNLFLAIFVHVFREDDQIWLAMELCEGGTVVGLVNFLQQKQLPSLRVPQWVLPNLILAENHNSAFLGGRNSLRSQRGLPNSGLSPWAGIVIFETFLLILGVSYICFLQNTLHRDVKGSNVVRMRLLFDKEIVSISWRKHVYLTYYFFDLLFSS